LEGEIEGSLFVDGDVTVLVRIEIVIRIGETILRIDNVGLFVSSCVSKSNIDLHSVVNAVVGGDIEIIV